MKAYCNRLKIRGNLATTAFVILVFIVSIHFESHFAIAGFEDSADPPKKVEVQIGIQITLGGISHTSSDMSLAISKENVFAVPRGVPDLSLQVVNLSPTSDIASHLKWKVLKNLKDTVAGSACTLISDGMNATLKANQTGSFNVIVYIDKNHNRTFDSGEQLCVLHFAVVEMNYSITVEDTNNVWTPADDGINFGVTTAGHAIDHTAIVLLQGGGDDRLIGVSKIGVGWLGNLLADTITGNYGGGHSNTTTWGGASLPMLDTANVVNGGDSTFRASSVITGGHNNPSGEGYFETASASDQPGQGCEDPHDFGGVIGNLPLQTFSGALKFTDYLSAYSGDFNTSYSAFYYDNWTWSPNFTNISGVWTDGGSSCSFTGSDSQDDGGGSGITVPPTPDMSFISTYH